MPASIGATSTCCWTVIVEEAVAVGFADAVALAGPLTPMAGVTGFAVAGLLTGGLAADAGGFACACNRPAENNSNRQAEARTLLLWCFCKNKSDTSIKMLDDEVCDLRCC